MTPPSILILDDEPSFGELLVDCLSDEGYAPTYRPLAQVGYRAIAAARPGLVVADLPAASPARQWELLTEIWRDAGPDRPPVILCSAYVNFLRDHAEELAARGVLVLEKPFDLEDILARVEAALRPR